MNLTNEEIEKLKRDMGELRYENEWLGELVMKELSLYELIEINTDRMDLAQNEMQNSKEQDESELKYIIELRSIHTALNRLKSLEEKIAAVVS